MIYRLRNRFIRIMMLSSLTVFVLLLLILYIATSIQTNASLEIFADLIYQNDGTFPTPGRAGAKFDALPFGPDRMNPELPFATRFFIVQFDQNGEFAFADITSISSITNDEAQEYAEKALEKGKERGWMGDYRYKVYKTSLAQAVVFINGADTRAMNQMFVFTAAIIFAGSILVVLILVLFLSKRAMKPIAESYEKQKRFVTDANHELKTPLTIIRADLDLAEDELGENEWLNDIRDVSDEMTAMVGKLVALARMDEGQTQLTMLPFNLSDALSDTAEAFRSVISSRGFDFHVDIASGITYIGDEALIRQLLSILLDNAAKYCDVGGSIAVTFRGGKHPILTVDNSFTDVDSTDLKRLFDRFYRADEVRAYIPGSGVGLSIAQAIVEGHHGKIKAQKVGVNRIQFWIKL